MFILRWLLLWAVKTIDEERKRQLAEQRKANSIGAATLKVIRRDPRI